MASTSKIDESKVIAEFDRRAEEFGDLNAVLDASSEKDVRRQNVYRDYIIKSGVYTNVDLSREDTVLDFGCGVGRLSVFIGRYVGFVEGVDISSSMIKAAIRSNPRPNIRYSVCSGDLPFGENHFDRILACLVLQHIGNETLAHVLKDFRKVLKDSGSVYVFEQVNEKAPVISEIHIQRRLADYSKQFADEGFDIQSIKPVFRYPSYGLSIWRKYKFLPRLTLPLLAKVEQLTVERKPGFIEYMTYLMVLKKRL